MTGFDAYDRARLRPTVVHIGPGVFHRAHQAVYADELLRAGHTTGAIWAIAPRSADLQTALRERRYVYHVIELPDRPPGDRASGASPPDLSGVGVRAVGSLLGVDVAAHDVGAALARLGDPAVSVVTSTVTEHGYGAIAPGGPLDRDRPEIAHDLVDPAAPQSVPGLIVEALARRRAAGIDPFTVASCDNLPSNGRSVRRVVVELAAERDERLADWISGHVAFPSSMVDRMVPATTAADLEAARRLGIDDDWPVVAERFSQWVLEDRFPYGRPRWEEAGVELVPDVSLHEQAKLRILNAAHSAIAYWGLLCGFDEIAAAVADDTIAGAVTAMLDDEVLPTLASPPGWSLEEYARSALARFGNPALPYTTRKVAGDGSQKLVVRSMPTVRAVVAAGARPAMCELVLAAWVVCMAGPAASRYDVHDPALRDEVDALRAGGVPVTADRAVEALVCRPGLIDPSTESGRAQVARIAADARSLWMLGPPDVRTHLADRVRRRTHERERGSP
jgi:fructuronate reductase